MKKTFGLIFIFALVLVNFVSAQTKKVVKDTTYVSRLSPKESRIIRNLVNSDSSFISTHINLQLELLKFDANLLYKYRLDSINSEIPLNYNTYVQSFIDVFVKNRKTQLANMLNLGDYYFPIFENALDKFNVPKEFKYLPIVESSMKPNAISRVGATGLWQFMYTTAKGYGLKIDNFVDERKDPISSSYAAAAYLKNAYKALDGDWLLALASYNCGIGAVSRAIVKSGGGKKTFWDIMHLLPRETQTYVPKFIAVTYMMSYYDKHFDFQDLKFDNKINIDSIYVNKFVSFDSLSKVLAMESDELKILNPSYKKNLVNGTPELPKRLIIPKIDFMTYSAIFDVLNSDNKTKVVHASYNEKEETEITPNNKITYTVKKGESLNTIANKYNVEVQDIKVWNKLKTVKIVPGQKVVIYPVSADSSPKKINAPKYITYVVKKGDTLSTIADKYKGATIASIKETNNLKTSALRAGSVLKIKQL